METVIWEVDYLSPPKVILYCKKCKKDMLYSSSELFRVNANQKNLDIWLIYKCDNCKNTWKLPIYSRVNSNKFDMDLLNKFTNNDNELAFKYAMDIEILKKYKIKINNPIYNIVGKEIDFKKNIKLIIKSKYNSNIKLSKILKEKLNITNRELEELILNKNISLEKDININNRKLEKENIIYINI